MAICARKSAAKTSAGLRAKSREGARWMVASGSALGVAVVAAAGFRAGERASDAAGVLGGAIA